MASEDVSAAGRERVIVFTRYPELGKVKSRLAKGIGEARALEIHDRLARHAVEEARRWGGDLEIRITGGTEDLWQSWLGEARWVDQGEGDLGERLWRAVADAFDAGCNRVVVMGSDCPGLDRRGLAQAFLKLGEADVVFGPALDGGYYLIGFRRPVPSLFEGIDWGSDRVLEQSLAKAPEAALMGPLGDVDVVDDLKGWDWLEASNRDR